MLNKKQLEDVENCMSHVECRICSSRCSMKYNDVCSYEEIEKLAKTALAYREMLERHVWHKRSSDGKEFCIECRNLKENGHTKDCDLQKLLKEG